MKHGADTYMYQDDYDGETMIDCQQTLDKCITESS
jgi:hypothetical protein